MRVHINLASEPFRRDRPILVGAVACGAVLVALLGVLVFLIVNERGQQMEIRDAVAKLNSESAHDLHRADQVRWHAAPTHQRHGPGAQPVAQLADPAQID